MTAKFSLIPSPTFKSAVEIPCHEGPVTKPVFTFRHRSRAEIDELIADKEISDVDLMMAICVGWDIEAEFSKANVELLCQNYMMAPRLIYMAYLNALSEGVKGN